MKNILKDIVGIEDFKTHKLYFFVKIIVSLIFALTILLDSMITFSGNINGSISETYFNNIEAKNIIIFFACWIITYIVLGCIQVIINKIEKTIYKKENKPKKKRVYFLILAIIIICWLPYILSYFPGGVFSDTADSINQAEGVKEYKNNNPLLYTFILKAFIELGNGSIQTGMELFTIFQFLVMAIVVSYAIFWLYKRNVSTTYIVLATAFFGLFKLIPMYAISIWKDTPFCIALLALTIFLAETIYQDGKNLEKISGIIKYAILMFFVVFLRNNGLYIAVAITLILMIVYRKKLIKNLKCFSIMSVIGIVAVFIVQGPIYNKLNLNSPIVESLGVPLQQICYVVATDGNLSQEQKEFIENIYPEESIKQMYKPCIVDSIKFDEEFNRQYLEDNKIEFLKIWGEVLLQNPVKYIQAYLLNSMGFWDVNKATFDGYISPEIWNYVDLLFGINQNDIIKNTTGVSIKNIIYPNIPISSAIYLFIMIFSAIFVIYKKRYKNLIIFLPAFFTWGTIMLAVPLAFSLRYVFTLLLVIPFVLLAPFLKQEKE